MEETLTKNPIISSIQIYNLWERKDILWNNVDPHVNILVGPNGSGKSTLLRIINSIVTNSTKELDKTICHVYLTIQDHVRIVYEGSKRGLTNSSNLGDKGLNTEYINTFDIPTSKKSEQSQLMQELDKVIYEHKKQSFSFYDYRMKILNFPDKRKEIEGRIERFFHIIDRFFEPSKKKIEINRSTNKLAFTFTNSNEEITLEDLSSGEKQLLIILFKVFLKENKPTILLMDEPEISLHIEWQAQLINAIQELNPNCQIILSTHSPSIFADGWGDKLVFMEDIVKPT